MRLLSVAAIALAIVFAAPASARPRARAERWPQVAMQHLTTHEKFLLRPDRSGRLGRTQLSGLKRFLRCHHTGRQHAMAPRLPALLYTIARHFGARPITVVAGYRAPSVARAKGNPRSRHRLGSACDFRIDGVPLTTLRDYVRGTFAGVGVGYYPNANFVHLDVGRKKTAYWVDTSGPGASREEPPAEAADAPPAEE